MSADRYLRSTDGSDSDDGSTFALAKATLAGLLAIDTSGDRLFVSQVHSETTGTSYAMNFAGTLTAPSKLLCGNDAAEPPTALSTGALIACTASSGTSSINGSVYAYGIKFQFAAVLQLGAGNSNCFQHFDNCTFDCTGAGSSGNFASALDNDNVKMLFTNCSWKFANAGNYIQVGQQFEIKGGSALSGTSTPSALFKFPTDRTMTRVLVDGMDLSNFASTLVLFSNAGVPACRSVIRNCKLPASWSGTLTNAAPTAPGQRFEMFNCASTGINYAVWIEDYAGSIRHETTIVKTGGTSNGTTGTALKMATTANCIYPGTPLVSQDISYWNETTASNITITVDIIHDSVTNLKDDEVWLEVEYLGTSGGPLATIVNDCKADILATGADQTTSSATWTTTGLTNPNKQKLSVTLSSPQTQLKGEFIGRVKMAKASKTIYVDPTLQVS